MRFSITEKLPDEASVSVFCHFVNLLISNHSTNVQTDVAFPAKRPSVEMLPNRLSDL